MAHVKKSMMPKSWPVPRKGKRKRFIAIPSHGLNDGISLLFLLRDVLKIAATRKEARYMTLNGIVKINNKVKHNENFPVNVLDVLCLENKETVLYYKLEIIKSKFSLIEIDKKDANSKIIKIVGKKILVGGDVQMNLQDGQNVVSKDKFRVGDSVLMNTKEGKIEKVLGLKKGARIEILNGKHAGEKGEIVGFEDLVRGRNYEIKFESGSLVRLPYKAILVVG
jgi:small subunit ribosomal protein S4e